MSITDAIDPFARMFFFGALLEVCKLSEVKFQTLLQPLVVNEHIQRKDEFVTCMKRIEDLCNLDISQTSAVIPNEVLISFPILFCWFHDSRTSHLLFSNCMFNCRMISDVVFESQKNVTMFRLMSVSYPTLTWENYHST